MFCLPFVFRFEVTFRLIYLPVVVIDKKNYGKRKGKLLKVTNSISCVHSSKGIVFSVWILST